MRKSPGKEASFSVSVWHQLEVRPERGFFFNVPKPESELRIITEFTLAVFLPNGADENER